MSTRRPNRSEVGRRLVIGVLVLWGAGSLMVAADVVESRDVSFLGAWLAILVAGLAVLYVLRRAVVHR